VSSKRQQQESAVPFEEHWLTDDSQPVAQVEDSRCYCIAGFSAAVSSTPTNIKTQQTQSDKHCVPEAGMQWHIRLKTPEQ